ncbi:MAG TPA: sigma-54-dependent Fis family transcriptional regulator [Oligoflexia bacterium]|nr:sigma-54-dependent Fis family transcriptional regulator [Oligoflexia bacterium]
MNTESTIHPFPGVQVGKLSSKSSTHLRLLNELSVKLQSLLHSDNIYEQIVSAVQNKFHYHSFSIWSVSQDQTAMLRAQSGAYNKFIQPGFTIKGEGILGHVISTRKTYIASDVSQDELFTNLSLPVETKSQISIPVFVDQTLVAVLTVESNQVDAFDEEDVATYESLSAQLSVALTNSKLVGEIKSFNKKLQQTVDERTQELRKAHQRILEQQRLLQKENKVLKNLVTHEKQNEANIIGNSPALNNIISMVDKIAPTHATVLIQGESGTGKELIARRLHEKSERANAPYVTINCGALQETLLESELFGHEKGSFTGAVVQKMGLVETADGGTLFLDEIGEMSLGIQAKLLRFLQEGEVYRIGGKKPIRVNVRIISATNRDLESEVKNSRFREDLFYRLNTITLRMPPLRKRKEDIPMLTDFFLNNSRYGGAAHIKHVDPKVYETFQNYDWPGNIRELQNTIERLKILADHNEIRIDDVPFNIRMPRTRVEGASSTSGEALVDMSLDELEKQHILKVLSYHHGNKTKTAHSLGITIKTLYNKLHRYGLLKEAGGLNPQ